jgi:type III secretory pathway lipoprotein EscJ
MKTIRVIARENHQMADDTKKSVTVLNENGINAHAAGKQDDAGFWLIWIHEDGDFDRALTMLRGLGLPVIEGSTAHSSY